MGVFPVLDTILNLSSGDIANEFGELERVAWAFDALLGHAVKIAQRA